MNRITKQFENAARGGRKTFIPFVTAGDPDMETSKRIVLALAESGADIIELGVPFSDPIADGPVIQASSMRALDSGASPDKILRMVSEIRAASDVPIVLFSYLNPLYRYGINELARDAAAAGADGILVTDVIDQEAAAIADIFREQNIELISLAAPTTSDERLKQIAQNAGGFIYAVARTGITGAASDTGTAETLVKRIRMFTDLPVAVGFGISSRQQVEDVWRYADAAVVGSAIVNEIALCKKGDDPSIRVRTFVANLLPPAFNNSDR